MSEESEAATSGDRYADYVAATKALHDAERAHAAACDAASIQLHAAQSEWRRALDAMNRGLIDES